MKPQKLDSAKSSALVLGTGGGGALSLTELQAKRRSQKEINKRVEELKISLFRITEKHMEQAVSIIKHWITQDETQ